MTAGPAPNYIVLLAGKTDLFAEVTGFSCLSVRHDPASGSQAPHELMSELDDQLADDENLWRMWCEDGVTENTPLSVDVYFDASSREAAEQIADGLRRWGLTKVKIETIRTMVILKSWQITGVEDGTWSLDKLKDRTRRYVRLAEIFDASYDGCGALIDHKKIKRP
jgi:hypothetical protein